MKYHSILQQEQQRSYTYDWIQLNPKKQIGLHRQSTWELSYIVLGAGMRLIGDSVAPFISGEVILIPPAIPHCWYFDEEVVDEKMRIENITLCFLPSFLDKCKSVFPELNDYIYKIEENKDAVKFNGEKSEAIITLLCNMKQQNEAERLSSLIQLLILISDSAAQCVIGQMKKIDHVQERIKQIETFVICNAKRNISLNDIAAHMMMNRSAFCIFFKKNMGKTFITYLNEYRIELACKLLKEHKMAISEICYQVGFNNVPYFNKLFKRLKGISPSQY